MLLLHVFATAAASSSDLYLEICYCISVVVAAAATVTAAAAATFIAFNLQLAVVTIYSWLLANICCFCGLLPPECYCYQ